MPRKAPPNKRKKPPGRKPDLSEEQISQLETFIGNCNSIKTSCEALGISETTYYRWLEKAEDPKQKPCYGEFRERMIRARGLAKANGLKQIIDAGKTDWRARAWVMERVYHDEFGDKSKHDHTITGKIAVEHTAIHVHLPAAIASPRPQIRHIDALETPTPQLPDKP